MQLDRLTLGGVTRFREPVTLDLLAIPEGSLVAIVGDNGEGKTTLLDAVLAPVYLTMPSRRGTLPTYATGSDSFFEATYQVDSALVRCRVNVDGPRRTTKAVLDVSHATGERHVSEAGVKAYQAEVARIFPPLELALASAFAPQNRAGSFVTATAAERKELFGIALGLEQFAAWAETAKAAAAQVATTIAGLAGRVTVLVGLTAAQVLEELEAARAKARGEVDYNQEALELLKGSRDVQTKRRAELAADLDAYARAQMAHRAAQEAATAAAAEGVALLQERDARQREARQARQKVQSQAEADLRDLFAHRTQAEQRRAATVEALENKIAANQTIARRADEIREAARRKGEAEAALDRLRREMDLDRQELEDERALLRAAQVDLHQVEKVEATLAEARRQAGIVDEVPCRGGFILTHIAGLPTALGEPVDAGACRFLTDATAAAARIADLEAHVDARRPLEQAIALHTRTTARLDQVLAAKRRECETHEATVRQTTETAAVAPALAAVEERIASYQREITGIEATYQDRVQELETREAKLREDFDARLTEIDRLAAIVQASIEDRRTELEVRARVADFNLAAAGAELERTEGTAERVNDCDVQIAAIAGQIERLAGALATAEGESRRLTEELARRHRHVEELRLVEQAAAVAEDELAVWSTLARCFGRDGLPTLEIANAGPTVSSLTNELLETAYGPRFTVEVVTQVERADKKGLREDFTIRILDNQEGGQIRDIADLSGGERVLVEEALRAAIMIFVNARNLSPIRTICRDETTGALDPENAVRYVAMLRRLVTLAGAAHCLFITHNPECAALADVVVTVADGRLDVRPVAA